MTPDNLATLARAMGHDVSIDETAGYGVRRVVIQERVVMFHDEDGNESPLGISSVFNPLNNPAQAWEVLAWLANLPGAGMDISHKNMTGESLRRAIVEAAVRVAEDAK